MPRKPDPRLGGSSANDTIKDATLRHMVYLEGLKTRMANDILIFLDNEIIPDLKSTLATRLEKHMAGAQTNKRLEAMILQFEDIVKKFRNINTRVQGEMFEIALYEADFNLKILENSTPSNINYSLPSPEKIKVAVFSNPFDGKNMAQWFENVGDRAKSVISSEVRRGVIEGNTAKEIAKRVADSGVYEGTRRNLDAIVRTSIHHVANASKNEFFKQNLDVISKVQWVSTLDGRTSEQCRFYDGKTFDASKPHPTPPIHIRCRSSLAPVTKSLKEILGIDIEDFDDGDGQRVSMNGLVSRDLKYGDWLKTQNAAFQDDVLGKTRGRLFRDGGLSIDRFTNRNGHQYTLKQLKNKEKLAFEKVLS